MVPYKQAVRPLDVTSRCMDQLDDINPKKVVLSEKTSLAGPTLAVVESENQQYMWSDVEIRGELQADTKNMQLSIDF